MSESDELTDWQIMSSNIGEIARTGDRRKLLEAMRDLLADRMAKASPMVVAQIAGRLQDVARELDELPLGTGVSISDDLAARRKARRSKATPDSKATGSDI